MVFNVVISILSFAAIVISGISLAEKRKPGPQGEQGPQGIQGKQGPRGLKGDKGDNLTINSIDIKDIPFITVDEEKGVVNIYGELNCLSYGNLVRDGINPPPKDIIKIEKDE